MVFLDLVWCLGLCSIVVVCVVQGLSVGISWVLRVSGSVCGVGLVT